MGKGIYPLASKNSYLNTDSNNFKDLLSSAYIKSINNIYSHNVKVALIENKEFIGCIIYCYPSDYTPEFGITIFNRYGGKQLVAGYDITIEHIDGTSYEDGYLILSGFHEYTHVIVLGSYNFELGYID